MIDKFYKTLGVNKEATLADIKKAYRQKAKFLHPDLNNSPDAQEQFINLNEAYEYLQKVKTGKVYDSKKQAYTKPKSRYKAHSDWEQQESEKARERARAYANMQYEAFTKTSFYQTTVSLNIIIDFISVLSVLFIFIGAPLIGYFAKGLWGLAGGVFVIFVTTAYWVDILFHNRPKLNFKELWTAIRHVGKTKTFQLILVIATNLVLIYRIGFSTLISAWTLFGVFAVAIIVGIFASTRLQNQSYKKFVYLGLAPGIINLLLLLNFLIVSNETTETYTFTQEYHFYENRWYRSTSINLPNGLYDEYIGVRMFSDYDSMKDTKTISYTFADGLFGLRVLKSHAFK